MKKLLVILVLVFVSVLTIGCNNNTQTTINTIKETMDKIETVASNVYQISSNDIFNNNVNQIKDKGTNSEREIVTYTPSDNFEEEGTGYNGSTFTSLNENIFNQPNKFSQISQEITYLNDNTENLLKYIMLKTNNIKVICTQFQDKKITLNSEISKKSKNLCSKLLLNTNRLEITKNDVKNSYKKLKEKQVNGYESSDTYNEYTNLSSCLQTRNTYLNNICYDIDELENVMEEMFDNIETTKKTWSNIDTYKSNNTQNKKTSINNNKTNNDNYINNNRAYNYPNNYPYNNYSYGGYGITNPYYGYGGYGAFRGFGGNGYGMFPYSPYTNYNPYMPNIDTFGSYKNIDTYKPLNDNNEIIDDSQDSEYNNNYNDEDDCFYCPYCHRKIHNYCYRENTEDTITTSENNQLENVSKIDEKIDKITKKIQVVKPNKPPKIEKLIIN